jgi:hypothetical protein
MKRLSLLLLVLLGTVAIAGTAHDAAADAQGATMTDSKAAGDTQVLAIPDALIIRVDDDTTVPAHGASVWLVNDGGALSEVSLRFAVERAAVLELRSSEFQAEVDDLTLITMTADHPVWILAQGNAELLDTVKEQLAAGGTLEGLAAMPGNSGFPMLFDLENYAYQGAVQDAPVPVPAPVGGEE